VNSNNLIAQKGTLRSGDLKYSATVFFIYISVFVNSYVFFQEPFEFYIGYLIYLLLLPGFILKFGINRSLFFIFLILFVTGIGSVLIGDNTAGLFFKVFTGLSLSYFFYYYVVLAFDYDIEKLFKWYLYGCYIAALIGIVQFISFQVGFEPGYNFKPPLNKWGVVKGGNFGIRINSIFGEPTYLGAVLSSAFFISVYNLFSKKPYYLNKFQGIVIIVVYILSFSGLGEVGILLTVIFLAISFGLFRYFIIFIPIAVLMVNFMYTNIKEFRERYDGFVGLFFEEKKFELGKTHGSSFILYNNYVVATENFKTNFLFGSGLGSHPVSFDKYSIAKEIRTYGFSSNSADANSMFLRLMSETGIFGLGIFIFLIFKCYVRRNTEIDTSHWLISNGLLIMILLNLFRQGHYFLNGFPFFVIMYYYNHVNYQKYIDSLTEKDENSEALVKDPGPVSA
jgi:hypothetical protein